MVVFIRAVGLGRRFLEVQAAAIGRIRIKITSCGIYRIVAEGDGAAGVIVAFVAAVADGMGAALAPDGGDDVEVAAALDGDGAAHALIAAAAISAADARRFVAALGRDGAVAADADVAARSLPLARADARRSLAARGRDAGRAADGDAAARHDRS